MGNSALYCLHLKWIPQNKKLQHDQYQSVKGQNQCTEPTLQGASWRESDPTDGQDFRVFTQNRFKVNSNGGCDQEGAILIEFSPEVHYCYTYHYIKGLCFLVKWDETEHDWTYQGGCFDNGEHAAYGLATPDTVYPFDELRIEVRQVNDRVYDTGNESSSFIPSNQRIWATISFLLSFLSLVFFMLMIIAIGLLGWILF
jgi:hypothetical protein